MIRRHTSNGQLLLIDQSAHGRLAGTFAAAFGNDRFAEPTRPATAAAISMHDDGWSLHDKLPTLNPAGLPLDVFETPPGVAFTVWPASAERAAAVDPYAGLLVSLHQLSLSVNAASPPAGVKHETFDLSQPRAKFEFNKFQHREIERQEQLRTAIGLSIARPLKHGLAEPGIDPQEDALRFDFRLLQAMDQLSLAVCCTELPQRETTELHPRPGDKPIRLRLGRPPVPIGATTIVTVDPWPFSIGQIEASVSARRLPDHAFANVETFRAAYDDAERVEVFCRVQPVSR